LTRRSGRWFAASPCRATAEGLPPSLTQHHSRRSPSTSTSSFAFVAHDRVHRQGLLQPCMIKNIRSGPLELSDSENRRTRAAHVRRHRRFKATDSDPRNRPTSDENGGTLRHHLVQIRSNKTQCDLGFGRPATLPSVYRQHMAPCDSAGPTEELGALRCGPPCRSLTVRPSAVVLSHRS
jgi:hypothetical protein